MLEECSRSRFSFELASGKTFLTDPKILGTDRKSGNMTYEHRVDIRHCQSCSESKKIRNVLHSSRDEVIKITFRVVLTQLAQKMMM